MDGPYTIEMRRKCVEHAKLSQQIYIKLKRQILQLPISDDICKLILKFVGLRPIKLTKKSGRFQISI
jgi:hypothetical protein